MFCLLHLFSIDSETAGDFEEGQKILEHIPTRMSMVLDVTGLFHPNMSRLFTSPK